MVFMNYGASVKRFIRDPRTLFDWMYWGVRGIRVIALKDSYENDRGTLMGLSTLSKNQAKTPLVSVPLSEVIGNSKNETDTKELGDFFTKYGSDKATKHDYYSLYSFLLKGKRNLPLTILEIGLGTNNPDVPSNMGIDGKPGASLRAFRDWAPAAAVYGADVDKGILFSEDRISTFFVDQTDTGSLTELAGEFPKYSFDLIVDDGLHNTWANLNTLNFALDLIKPGGFFVVEDIIERYIPTWETAATVLSENYHCRLVKCKTEWVFIVHKK